MPYQICFRFNDGSAIDSDIPSLVVGVEIAQLSAQNFCDELNEVYIISNTTGEIVYRIGINVCVEIDFEVDNPYSL